MVVFVLVTLCERLVTSLWLALVTPILWVGFRLSAVSTATCFVIKKLKVKPCQGAYQAFPWLRRARPPQLVHADTHTSHADYRSDRNDLGSGAACH